MPSRRGEVKTVQGPVPDQVIGGRYRLLEQLGQGGMGVVFLAEQLGVGNRVALKFLGPSPDQDPARVARFLLEAKVALTVAHPGAAQLLDSGRDEAQGLLYLAFEYVEGQDLRALLTAEGRLGFEEARQVVLKVGEVLAFAHERGVVHRDVKPENIRVRRDLGGLHVKVLDFGIARLVKEGAVRLTAEGMLAGTPRYMAPEQVRDEPLDARTDVYAAGLVFYELLTGRTAFEGKNISHLMLMQLQAPLPRVGDVLPQADAAGVDAVLQRACAKVPAERWPSMAAFVAALKSLAPATWPAPALRPMVDVHSDAPTLDGRVQAPAEPVSPRAPMPDRTQLVAAPTPPLSARWWPAALVLAVGAALAGWLWWR
jgi:serine/threonine-protein kinase